MSEIKMQALDIQAQDVLDYLENHPNLLVDHPKLWIGLNLPQQTGGTSLMHHQVRVLKAQYQQLQNQLDDLVHIAENNERLFECSCRLTLSMMLSTDCMDAKHRWQQGLKHDFDVDATRVIFFTEPSTHVKPLENAETQEVVANVLGDDSVKRKSVESKCASVVLPETCTSLQISQDAMTAEDQKILQGFMHLDRPLCGALREAEAIFLFGSDVPIRSAVVAPFESKGIKGLLAWGSKNPHQYAAAQDSLFIRFICDLWETSLARWSPRMANDILARSDADKRHEQSKK